MPTSDQCPFCGSRQIFAGSIKCSERYTFLPHHVRTSLWRVISSAGIEFGPSAHLCAECGMIWARSKRQKAREFLESYGEKAAQAKLQDNSSKVPPHYPPPRLPSI